MAENYCDTLTLTDMKTNKNVTSGEENGGPSFENAKVGLKRQMSLISLIAFLIGSVIGSGIFATTKSVATYVDSAGGIILVWVGGGIIAILGGLTWCELGGMFPNACGNKYTYITAAFGDMLGFVYIYLETIVNPISITLICMVAGDYVMVAIVGEGESTYTKMVAAILIVINMVVNCVGVKWGEWTQILFTSLKLGAIAIIVVTGFVRLGQGHNENFINSFNGSSPSVSNIGYALYGSMYSYGGWESVNSLSAESSNPIKHGPIALSIGIPFIIICYVLVNVAYLTVLTPSQLAISDAVAVTIAKKYYGVMSWIIPVLVGCSCFGTANAYLFCNARLLYEGSHRGHLPKILGTVHIKRHTPMPAIIFNSLAALIVLLPKSSTFINLLNYISFVGWACNALTIAGMLWMRKSRPNIKRPFKVFILIPIVLLIISVFLVIAPFYSYPIRSSYGFIIILPALPLYFAFVKYQILPKRILQKYHMITEKIQLLFNLSLPDHYCADQNVVINMKDCAVNE